MPSPRPRASEQVKQLLAHYSRADKGMARRLALHLAQLRNNPRPGGSRALTGDLPEDREWVIEGWEVLYQVDADDGVFIAKVTRS